MPDPIFFNSSRLQHPLLLPLLSLGSADSLGSVTAHRPLSLSSQFSHSRAKKGKCQVVPVLSVGAATGGSQAAATRVPPPPHPCLVLQPYLFYLVLLCSLRLGGEMLSISDKEKKNSIWRAMLRGLRGVSHPQWTVLGNGRLG